MNLFAAPMPWHRAREDVALTDAALLWDVRPTAADWTHSGLDQLAAAASAVVARAEAPPPPRRRSTGCRRRSGGPIRRGSG